MTWVQLPWRKWKERTDSNKLSSDLHRNTIMCSYSVCLSVSLALHLPFSSPTPLLSLSIHKQSNYKKIWLRNELPFGFHTQARMCKCTHTDTHTPYPHLKRLYQEEQYLGMYYFCPLPVLLFASWSAVFSIVCYTILPPWHHLLHHTFSAATSWNHEPI